MEILIINLVKSPLSNNNTTQNKLNNMIDIKINPKTKGASKMELLLWEYEMQRLAQNSANLCDVTETSETNPSEMNANFSFEANFDDYGFGINQAWIQYDDDFNFTSIEMLFILQVKLK